MHHRKYKVIDISPLFRVINCFILYRFLNVHPLLWDLWRRYNFQQTPFILHWSLTFRNNFIFYFEPVGKYIRIVKLWKVIIQTSKQGAGPLGMLIFIRTNFTEQMLSDIKFGNWELAGKDFSETVTWPFLWITELRTKEPLVRDIIQEFCLELLTE